MTATEELRRLLDERGVEYEVRVENITGIEHIIWHTDEFSQWDWNEEFGAGWLNGWQHDVTPEQAIAATLGPCSDSCSCTNGERTNLAVTLGDADATPTRQGDAVEVVRCRDCKHRHRVRSWAGTDVDECWLHASPETGALGKVLTEPDGFCAWGEPREADA